MDRLLTREAFREECLRRDKSKCVVCGNPNDVVVHHLIERRLWLDGGYYISNGASVCEEHHLACERTLISVEDMRIYAGITKFILPPQLYTDSRYTKWGDEILPNGQRVKGELFHDESVQKVLTEGKVLDLYTNYVKAPRTYHLPWSPKADNPGDDRIMEDTSFLKGKEVIAFLKLDGENTTMYSDHIHARSIDSGNHESRNWTKTLHGLIRHNIPDEWRVQAENMYAKHSIYYEGLKSFLYGFGVWNEKNIRLPWDTCVEWFELLNMDLEGTGFSIQPCPYFYRGIWSSEKIQQAWVDFQAAEKDRGQEHEGYVVHLSGSFHYSEYRRAVGKWVRKDHVPPHALFWHKTWIPNKLIIR